MKPIDLTYRFDPDRPDPRLMPADARQARELLEEGNRLFARWIEACRASRDSTTEPPSFLVACGAHDLGLPSPEGIAARQAPFAVLLGCSDARVPAEAIFGQPRNNLFTVRVAGNVLADECLGSIDFALHTMRDSVRLVVVLGHTGCGAVTAAVDTYLNPWDYLATAYSLGLRSIIDRIGSAVRQAARALETVAGRDVASRPGYRETLIDVSVFVNAMQSAYKLQMELERSSREHVRTVFGVFDLVTHRLKTAPPREGGVREVVLADAPADLREFEELALRVAHEAVPR